MTGMGQGGCCGCGPKCGSLTADTSICCIEVTNTGWSRYGIMLSRYNTEFSSGDACPNGPNAIYSNLCGDFEGIWTIQPAGNDWDLQQRPHWDNTSHVCAGLFRLRWHAINDGDNVSMELRVGNIKDLVRPGFITSFAWPIAILDPDWYVDGYTVEDLVYKHFNDVDPINYPGPIPTFTFKPCPETYEEFPDPDDRVIVSAQFQRLSGGSWTNQGSKLYAEGNCVCGGRCTGRGAHNGSFGYTYSFWEDSIVITRGLLGYAKRIYLIPYSGCGWSEGATALSTTEPTERVVITSERACPNSTVPPPPPPPCDPGCWPECLKCPDPLDVALVISEDPDCCAANTYGMSYNSGRNRYEIAGPVGGPAGVCASITYFRMTCASSTTVTFTWQYVNVNGSTHDRTDTVDVTCGEGTFETDAVDVLSTLFSPGLCEGGFGKGANVRVVSV